MSAPDLETEPPRWRLHLDMAITRRKLYHIVENPEGVVTFRSRFASECMAWLDLEGVDRYELVPSAHRTLGSKLAQHEARKVRSWQS